MFKFITSKPLWVNIVAVIVLMLLIVLFFFGIIGWLTKHDQYEKVPAVIGQHIDEATKILEAKGFTVEIQDSVYIDTAMRLSVIRQSPDADAVVKSHRTVYLTINRAVPPLTAVPNMVGFSFRSAEMMLHTLGLKLGDTSYKPDIARNTVLEQIWQGKTVAPGTKIPMGSTIDFILASGAGSEEMNVPGNVIGMTLAQAKEYLASMNINVGAIVPPELAANAGAFVYKTNPPQYSETAGQRVPNKIRPGQLLDLFVTTAKPVADTIAAPPEPGINE